MISRLLVLGILGFLAVWAASGSYAGSGAVPLWTAVSPEQAIAQHQTHLREEAERAARVELDRRYRAGEMGAAERADYEAMIERERQEEIARQRAAAAAAARAATLRNTRSTGGGPSGGK